LPADLPQIESPLEEAHLAAAVTEAAAPPNVAAKSPFVDPTELIQKLLSQREVNDLQETERLLEVQDQLELIERIEGNAQIAPQNLLEKMVAPIAGRLVVGPHLPKVESLREAEVELEERNPQVEIGRENPLESLLTKLNRILTIHLSI